MTAGTETERKIHLVTVKGNVQKAEGNKSATTRYEPLKIKSHLFFESKRKSGSRKIPTGSFFQRTT